MGEGWAGRLLTSAKFSVRERITVEASWFWNMSLEMVALQPEQWTKNWTISSIAASGSVW